MGFIGGLLGTDSGNTGSAGMNFQAGAYNPYQTFTPEQIQDAYKNAQSGLSQQQSFVDALKAQNGIQNQSDVYNQFNQIAQGTGGPNPAQAMLNQATGANTANQAALMASQRGAGANTGLIARQAAQQGGALQQNAAGQAAIMRAQQQQNALNSLGGIAGQQVGELGGGIQGYNQAAQNEQAQMLGAASDYNRVQQASMASQNAANAGIAGQTSQGQQKLLGGALGGAGSALNMGSLSSAGAAFAAHGGMIQKYADGGNVMESNEGQEPPAMPTADEPISWAGKFLKGYANPQAHSTQIASQESPTLMARGGKVPAMVSPGEIYLPPQKAKEVAKKGQSALKDGEKIPGKAKVTGDSLKNDVVSRNLDVGGVVIPRSKVDDAKSAVDFVSAVLAKHGQKIPGKK